jgi:D-threo-aldose 1-dehydrogenase
MEAVKEFNSRSVGKTDLQITELGLGGAGTGNLYMEISDEQAEQTIKDAWKAGVRYFDTAPYYGYGLAEQRLGNALKEFSRSSYVISTKAGRVLKSDTTPILNDPFVNGLPFRPHFDYSYDGVMRSFEESLQRMQVDYIDILFIHDIGQMQHGSEHEEFFKIMIDGGCRALDDLRSQKAIRAIGLGVNEYEVCMEVMPHTDMDCFMLAGRYTLLEQGALQDFLPECARRQISVMAAGPYNSGILATGPTEGSNYNYKPADKTILARVHAIQKICEEFSVLLPQAAINFPILHPQVAAVVVGAHSSAQILMTKDYLKKSIPQEFWQALKKEGLLASNAPVSLAK